MNWTGAAEDKLVYRLSVNEGTTVIDAVKDTVADVSSVSPSSERMLSVVRSGRANAPSVSYCFFHGVYYCSVPSSTLS